MFEFKFPDVGEGVHEGKVLQFKVNPGDKVEQGDILAIVETDKVVAEIPSSQSGTLVKFGIEEGQIIEVGKTLAFINVDGAPVVEPPKNQKVQVVEENAGVVGELDLGTGIVLPASGEGLSDTSFESVSLLDKDNKVKATPLARKLAKELGVDLKKLKGSGPLGRIMKHDILNASTNKVSNSQSVPSAKDTSVETGHISKEAFSTMRKTIAKKMEESNAIPTATFHELCTIDALKDFRESYNKSSKDRLSFQPIFIKALALALKKFKSFNATFDSTSMESTIHDDINIGIAMETPKGLMVPVIRNCERKSILEINKEMTALVEKARAGNISLEELRGGTFSITNYGAFGGLYGNPMILAPQVGILGFGRIHQAPVVKNGNIQVGTVLPISFAFDHRVIDGAPAAQFIRYMQELLDEPNKMILAMV